MSTSTLLAAVSVLVGVIGLRYFDPPIISSARLSVYDTYQTLAPRQYERTPVRIIDIDDASLAEFGQWPWPRTLIAELVDTLTDLGAASIAFDMVFAEPDRMSPQRYFSELLIDDVVLEDRIQELPDNDEVLAKSIANAPVVLGIGGSPLPSTRNPILKTGFAHGGSNPINLVNNIGNAVINLEILEQAAKGQGSFAIDSAQGGIVRRIPLLQRFNNQLLPTLVAESLRVAQGATTILTRASDASGSVQVGGLASLESMRIGDLEIPLTEDGQLWLHYTKEEPTRTVSVKDVLLSNDRNSLLELIQGQIVLIGTSATGLKDIRATPINAFESGVVIHAQALEQILLQRFLQRPSWANGFEILTLLALSLLLIFCLSKAGAIWSAVVGIAATGVVITGSWIAFTKYQLLIDPLYGLLAALLIYIVTTVMAYIKTEKNRNYIKKAFSSYLSPALVDLLSDDPSMLKLDGESKSMSFLFTDIAEFTALTEKTEPTLLIKVLNEYLDGACQIIIDNGGTIDKMIGDAIVAIYNAPLEQKDHAQRAVETALLLDKYFVEFIASKKLQGVDMGTTRIGINTGEAIVGNLGGAQRFDYTAIGDAVNTAARMESANKHLGTKICVSDETKNQCTGLFFKPIASLILKGKTVGVEIYEPISETVFNSKDIQSYIDIYNRIKNNEPTNLHELVEIQKSLPDDPVIALHLQRMQQGELGVEIVMDKK